MLKRIVVSDVEFTHNLYLDKNHKKCTIMCCSFCIRRVSLRAILVPELALRITTIRGMQKMEMKL